MPRNISKAKKTAKGRHPQTDPSVKPHSSHRRPVPEEIGTSASLLVEDVVTKLVRPAVRAAEISVAYDNGGDGSGLMDSAARITGVAFAMSSIPIVAPILFLAQVYITSRELQAERDEFKSREYLDEGGEIHHHTRPFMRDHAGEPRTVAA